MDRLGGKYSKGEDQVSADCLKDLFEMALKDDKSESSKGALYSVFLLADEYLKRVTFYEYANFVLVNKLNKKL